MTQAEVLAIPKIGTIKYTYKGGKVSSFMFGYIDDYADEPAWYWRWTVSDPTEVRYILDRYPELEREGEVVL